MNPYQVVGVIACCASLFAGVVTFLALQGVPVLVAFFGFYLVAVCTMLGMQRRARDSSRCAERQRRHREPSMRATRQSEESGAVPSVALGGKTTSRA